MAPSRDDLDWLYGRQRPAEPEPEPTKVLPHIPPNDLPSPQPKPRRPKRRFFRFALLVLAAMLVFLLAVPIYAWSQIRRVDATPTGDRPADQPGTTILLLGSDSREGLSEEEQEELGTGHTAGQRTDTIMIMYVPVGGEPALISIPRDSYRPIPGNGSNKINAAYAFGGPKLMVETIEHNTGLRMDAYVEVGFGGFVNVIDALGGVDLCLKKAIKDKDAHIDLPAGCQELSGADALGYVRMRKSDPRGDLGRVERQRAVMSAMAARAATPSTVLNPVKYWRFANAGARSVTLGEDTTARELATFARAMAKVSSGKGLTLTVPISNPNASTSAGSSVLWDDEGAKDMFADIARGDTSDLKKYAK